MFIRRLKNIRKRHLMRTFVSKLVLLPLLFASLVEPISAFTSSKSMARVRLPQGKFERTFPATVTTPTSHGLSIRRSRTTTRTQELYAVPAALAAWKTTQSFVSISAMAIVFMLTFLRFRRMNPKERFFYPRVIPDPNFAEPLPEGNLGCPFFGNVNAIIGSKSFGVGHFYLTQGKKLADAAKRVWMYYFVGRPVIVLAGAKNLKTMLNSEFEEDGVMTISASGKKRLKETKKPRIMGPESMLAEGDKERHSQLRRLVGEALTPAAVAKSIPSLELAAKEQAKKLKSTSSDARLEDFCTEFTLDVAWRQILGLKLSDEEIPEFRKAVYDWINGASSIQAQTGIGIDRTPGYKARFFIESKIRERIRALESTGPDSSTLSGMVFAKDDEGDGKKLSEDEIVDNAICYDMANAMLCMGLNREKWQKLVDEQNELVKNYGPSLDKNFLDSKNSPYLEAVVKETMRLRPPPSGIPRRVKATTIVDGKQIPEGFMVDWSIVLTHQLDPVTYKEDDSHMDMVNGFQPERWLQEETTPTEYMPLGGGPRYCLGSNLAMAEMKVFLAIMAREIDFQLSGATAKKLRWKRLSIIPKEENGVLIRVLERDGKPVSSEVSKMKKN